MFRKSCGKVLSRGLIVIGMLLMLKLNITGKIVVEINLIVK